MDGRRRWWDGVWCWNWYWQTVAVLCLSIQGRRTYRATGKGTFFVGPSPNRGGGGCPTYVGASLSKDGHLHPGRDGEPAILATVDSAVEFREGPNILSVRPGVGMPARLALADSQWSCGPPAHSTSAGHKSGMPAAQPAPSPPPAACITYGSWARDGLPALHMDILCSLAGRRRGLRGVAACPVKWKHGTLLGAFGSWRGQLAQLRSTALWSLTFSFQVIPKVT